MKQDFIVFLIGWTSLISVAWYSYSQIAVSKARAETVQALSKNSETTSKVCMAWWFGKPELSVKHRQYACR